MDKKIKLDELNIRNNQNLKKVESIKRRCLMNQVNGNSISALQDLNMLHGICIGLFMSSQKDWAIYEAAMKAFDDCRFPVNIPGQVSWVQDRDTITLPSGVVLRVTFSHGEELMFLQAVDSDDVTVMSMSPEAGKDTRDFSGYRLRLSGFSLLHGTMSKAMILIETIH